MVPANLAFLLAPLLVVLVFNSDFANSEDQSQSECVNCTICPYPCHSVSPPPGTGYPAYGAPPPPPPVAEYHPPPPQAQGNCPPAPVLCCTQPPTDANAPPNPNPNQNPNQNPYTYIPPADVNFSAFPYSALSLFHVFILIFSFAVLF